MFEKLPQSSGSIIGYKTIGKLEDKDYKKVLIPEMEKLIAEHGKIRVLMDMSDYAGATLHAAMDDTIFGFKHDKDFERCAVVGNKTWEEWIIKISRVFMRCDMKYFDIHQIDEAWEWLKS